MLVKNRKPRQMLHREKPKKSFSCFYRINSVCVIWVSSCAQCRMEACVCDAREECVSDTEKLYIKSSPWGIRIRSSCGNLSCCETRERKSISNQTPFFAMYCCRGNFRKLLFSHPPHSWLVDEFDVRIKNIPFFLCGYQTYSRLLLHLRPHFGVLHKKCTWIHETFQYPIISLFLKTSNCTLFSIWNEKEKDDGKKINTRE